MSMMMTLRRPHHVRNEHPRFSRFVFLHPIVRVIFLRLISRERETRESEKKTYHQCDDIQVTTFCLSSSSFLLMIMLMITLHVSFKWCVSSGE